MASSVAPRNPAIYFIESALNRVPNLDVDGNPPPDVANLAAALPKPRRQILPLSLMLSRPLISSELVEFLTASLPKTWSRSNDFQHIIKCA